MELFRLRRLNVQLRNGGFEKPKRIILPSSVMGYHVPTWNILGGEVTR
jgi:hypothetical protein